MQLVSGLPHDCLEYTPFAERPCPFLSIPVKRMQFELCVKMDAHVGYSETMQQVFQACRSMRELCQVKDFAGKERPEGSGQTAE